MMADAQESDRARWQDGEQRAILLESTAEALANGPQGWYDDSWNLSMPWDFALEDVGVPVHIWYAADDRNAPPRSVELMAARLNVASIDLRAGGHLGDTAREEQVWRTLLAAF